MKRRLPALVLFAAAPVLALAAPVHASVATNSSTNYCPFDGSNNPNGIDADYVTFLGPSTIPAGISSSVAVGAAEEEAANNPVSLNLVVTTSTPAGPSLTQETVQPASGTHDTTTSVSLTGVPGTTYTINWVATFDAGVHPCASATPGHNAFTVTVS